MRHSRLCATENAVNFLSGIGLYKYLYSWLNLYGCYNEILIIQEIIDSIKTKISVANVFKIPNWNRSFFELLLDTDIWLATEEDLSKGITVYNRFTNNSEKFWLYDTHYEDIKPKDKRYVEQINPNEEGIPVITPDYLAFYCNLNGCIVFMVDRIQNCVNHHGFDIETTEWLYRKILIHEFIHSAVDLYPRDRGFIINPKPNWVYGNFTEETIDNALIIHGFHKTPHLLPLIKKFIASQPPSYNIALTIDSKKLNKLLSELINYKVGNTNKILKPGCKYVVNGLVLDNICRAAEEIFRTILEKENYVNIVSWNNLLSRKIINKAQFLNHCRNQEAKGSTTHPDYYSEPIMTLDGYEVYVYRHWHDKIRSNDFDKLLDLTLQFSKYFPGGFARI